VSAAPQPATGTPATGTAATGPAATGPAVSAAELGELLELGELAELTELAELATASGIEVEWVDQAGNPQRVGAATMRAVLGGLGTAADDAVAVRQSLERLRTDRATRLLPEHVVAVEGVAAAVVLQVPGAARAAIILTLEDGTTRRVRVTAGVAYEVAGRPYIRHDLHLPAALPPGYHRLRARVGAAGRRGAGPVDVDVPVIVAPARLPPPAGGRRVFGVAAQLYSVRSEASFGLGDLGDLAELAAWAGAEHGAAFVAVNPLCAGAPSTPREDSPYLPTTKRFTDPSYLSVRSVPEYASLDGDRRRAVDALAAQVAPDRSTVPADPLEDPAGVAAGRGLLDRDAAWAAKSAALRIVHDAGRTAGRQALFERFVADGGADLRRWAVWWVLADLHGPDSRRWPAELRHPDGPAVADAARRHESAVAVVLWCQWCLAEQLDGATRVAAEAGMAVGIIHDLPIGVHPGGADTWTLPGVFAEDMSVGAPPDMFNQQGQDWSAPPMRPDRLAGDGLWTFRDQVRSVLSHAGGVRIDHVLGLFRLWWVPAGLGAAGGAFVRYDHEALLSILVLEAHRSGAVVIGEDLGTVAPWVQEYLAGRGVLGTSILWFEHDEAGRPRRPQDWRAATMGSVTVHDLPPTPGYLAGEHLRLRSGLGQLTRPLAAETAEDEADRARWVEALRAGGHLHGGGPRDGPPADGDAGGDASTAELVLALHRYLAATPVVLLAVGLPDAVGDRRVQNLPGTSTEYPNWRLPLTGPDGRPLLLDEVEAGSRAALLLDTVRDALGSAAGSAQPGGHQAAASARL